MDVNYVLSTSGDEFEKHLVSRIKDPLQQANLHPKTQQLLKKPFNPNDSRNKQIHDLPPAEDEIFKIIARAVEDELFSIATSPEHFKKMKKEFYATGKGQHLIADKID